MACVYLIHVESFYSYMQILIEYLLFLRNYFRKSASEYKKTQIPALMLLFFQKLDIRLNV